MRPVLAIAVTLALGLASLSSAAEVDGARDAGAPPRGASVTPADGGTGEGATRERGTDEGATEGLPSRLGKAAAFGLVVTALLLAGGVWRRGRRRRLPRPR
ncbi:MAG: hypothetical protein KF894_03565 [Labilithrix sp.]|nr:hypothetical protein [Labilithrix sp.]